MIRPDEIVTAVGGRVMQGAGVEYLQNSRVGRENPASFTRASAAWVRAQRNKWVQVSSGVPRYGQVKVSGELILGLTLESSGRNELRFSSVLSSTVRTSTGAAVWIGSSSLSTADSFSSTGVSMLEGETAVLFRNGGGSSEHGIYQDPTVTPSQWAVLSGMVERRDSTGFAMRVERSTDGVAVMEGVLDWSGEFTATLSSGGNPSFPVYTQVHGLGIGPNGGRSYRVSMGARVAVAGRALRATLFPAGLAASTRATYLHHAQFTDIAGGRELMVRPTTAAANRAADQMKVPAVNTPGGAMSLYQESVLSDRPGIGGEPTTSTDPLAVFLALARGWTSTDGPRFVGGGIYNREGDSVVAGSTGKGIQPGDHVEQLVSISTNGRLTYQVRVSDGPVFTARSTGTLRPEQQAAIPSYTFSNDQVLLLNVLARGVHDLDDFRSFFR